MPNRAIAMISGAPVHAFHGNAVDHDCFKARHGFSKDELEAFMREEAREGNHSSLRRKF